MNELKLRQVCLILLAFIPVTKIFTLPATLSHYAHEDLLLSALIPFALDFLVLGAVWYASRRAGCDFPAYIRRSATRARRSISSSISSTSFSKPICPSKSRRTLWS